MPEQLLLTASVEIQAASAADKPARVSILAYTGDVMSVSGWGLIAIDLAGLDISAAVQLLADHKNDLANVLGSGVATVINGQLLVDGTLSRSSEAAGKIIALSKDGVAFQASVGVQPTDTERIAPNQAVRVNGKSVSDPRGFTLVKRGTLREVSLVPLGCDSSTSVAIAASKGRSNMTTTDTTIQAERDRLSMISAACDSARGGIVGEQLPERLSEIRASAIAENWTEDALTAKLLKAECDAYKLQALKASAPKGPQIRSGSMIRAGALQGAMFAHLGHETLGEKAVGPEAMQAGRELRCTSMVDIVKAALQMEGRDVPVDRNEMIKAGFSTHTLTTLLSTTGNKLMLDAYQAVPSVARIVAKKLSANDFKTQTGYRMIGDGAFEELGPSGEIKHGTLTQSAYPYRVATYAKMYGITLPDIVNDDLGALNSVPQIIGRAAATKLEELFWTLVLANTSTFFGSGNGNYIDGAGSALGLTALGLAVAKMRQQTDSFGTPVMVVPKYLVVPPELEATADQLYSSTNIVLAGDTDVMLPDGNPQKGKYAPLVVPHLSNDSYAGYSTTGWYLFGLPSDVAAFGIAYLNGVESPTVEAEDASFNTLGKQFRGYQHFGVCQIDPRGAVMSKGTT